MRHAWLVRFAAACAVLGVLLAVLGVGLVVSRQKTEQGAQDRGLSATAGERAALVDTELERLRALALLTARIPPFSELYADEGSQAAAIAAVAGPGREINEALAYLWTLYPNVIVAAGYVDAGGGENARVVRGVPADPAQLHDNVRAWPAFAQGLRTPEGQAWISQPFVSSRAGVPVVAATTPVLVDGKPRAFVELELATSALAGVLSTTEADSTGLAVVADTGAVVSGNGRSFPALAGTPSAALVTENGWRYAIQPVLQSSLNGGHWSVVAAAPARSALSLALAPTQSGLIVLALLMFATAAIGLRRASLVAAEEFAAEQHARAEAERRSRTDGLTGLFNRSHAVEQLAHERARSSRDGTGVGLLVVDIDRFKRINDSQGHAGGDAVIVEVARRLQAGVREWDTVARIGGEEFFIIAPGLDTEAAIAELGERLRQSIAERPIRVPRGAELPVTVSAGAVLVRREDGSAEYAIDRADRALYAAKRRGRNRLCRFSQLDHIDLRAEQPECLHVAEALALTSDLRRGAPAPRSRMIAELCATIARRLDLTEDQILRTTLGGWLCDVGKVAIPDAILSKPGPLSDVEWDVVRTHSAVGEELLHKFPELAPAGPAVRHHHERYDGAGYPDRLAGEQIPLEARIVAVADAYSAMVTDRPNAAKRSQSEAIDELLQCAGTRFDPEIVAALAAEIRHGTRIVDHATTG